MKNILIDLYYGNINEAEKNISCLYNTTEYKNYEKLENELEELEVTSRGKNVGYKNIPMLHSNYGYTVFHNNTYYKSP